MTARAQLEVSGLTKRFGGLVAVKDMALRVGAGEILGLIGPNGSGKSTVMKLIMGIERPDAGSVRVKGIEVAGWPSHKIARMGAGIIFQHSRPLHRQSVIENIMLALLPDQLTRLLADPNTEARARAIAARVGLDAVLDRRPATLPFADLRRIEIAKAIARDPQVLLIDEPFAGLTSTETAAFSELICELRDDGRAVLLVDHNVKSVARLVDRVLAMYVGERIAEGTADEVMRNETVRRVYLGGSIETAARSEASFRDSDTPFLAVENVSVFYGKAQALENVSIHVHAGEFVSIVGLNGAGKTTIFNAISGFLPYAGDIRREGASLRGRTPAAIARHGIVQCPEGRELFTDMTVRENLDLGGQHLSDAERAEQIAWLFDLFPILRDRHKQAAGTLSGGEQQMLTIARALMMKPKLLILDEPTLGLAPVILEQLSKTLEKLRQTTAITVLLGEQNVTFALPHADRVYVLEHARIVWEGEPPASRRKPGRDICRTDIAPIAIVNKPSLQHESANMKTVLITGAAGDVGSRLRKLLNGTYPHLRSSDIRTPAELTADETFIAADLADYRQVDKIVAGVDGIVHLGGFSVEGPWHTILNANIIGCYNLFEAAYRAGVKRVVFASSNHAIGFYPRTAHIGVDVTVRPDSRYGVSKAFGEALAALYADKHGLRVACLRIGNVGDAPVDERRLSIWISPEDLVQLVRIGLEHPDLRYEIFYGVSDNAASWWDNSNARRFGYQPQGRAEDFRHDAIAAEDKLGPDPIAARYQGGPFCSDEYDADRTP